jgi:GTPase SAR1 family protein
LYVSSQSLRKQARIAHCACLAPARAHTLPILPSKFPPANNATQGADTVPLTIVGNKSDLRPEQRQVTLADGKKLAEELGCGFTEASARYNENVGKAFEGMIAEIEKGQEAGQPKEGNAKCAVM